MAKRGRNTVVPTSFCPYCLKKLNRAGHMNRQFRPRPGDFSVCIDCGNILQFDADLRVIKPALSVVEQAFRDDPAFEREVRSFQRAIARTNATLGQSEPSRH